MGSTEGNRDVAVRGDGRRRSRSGHRSRSTLVPANTASHGLDRLPGTGLVTVFVLSAGRVVNHRDRFAMHRERSGGKVRCATCPF